MRLCGLLYRALRSPPAIHRRFAPDSEGFASLERSGGGVTGDLAGLPRGRARGGATEPESWEIQGLAGGGANRTRFCGDSLFNREIQGSRSAAARSLLSGLAVWPCCLALLSGRG